MAPFALTAHTGASFFQLCPPSAGIAIRGPAVPMRVAAPLRPVVGALRGRCGCAGGLRGLAGVGPLAASGLRGSPAAICPPRPSSGVRAVSPSLVGAALSRVGRCRVRAARCDHGLFGLCRICRRPAPPPAPAAGGKRLRW